MTIRTRLILSYVFVTLFAMAGLAAYNLRSFEGYVIASMQAHLTERVQTLADPVTNALVERDVDRIVGLVQRHGGTPGDFTLRVFDHTGRLVATNNAYDRSVRDWRVLPGLAESLASQPASGRARGIGPSAEEERLFESKPLVHQGVVVGVLRISQSLDAVRAETRARLQISLAAIGATFVVCLLVGFRFARDIAEPVQAMRNFAQRLGGGTFGERIEVARSDELGELAVELNRMSERLAKLDDERRAFLANASHEMRTPVSNVLVTLDALESAAHDEPEMRQRFLETALDETRRLARLVHDLLDLGRLDAGVVQLEPHDVSLNAFLGRACRAIEPRMRTRGVRVAVDAGEIQVHADPERLLQAVMNVLDNALKYSPEGGVVHLRGRREDDRTISIEVRDEGPGIAAADLPHVFEPFYTADRARKRGGTGLGLAMARRIVAAHGGTISAANADPVGAVFTIRLPSAAAIEAA